jgi:hypothetical protein
MLRDFLNLWQAIKVVIELSTSKNFKKNKESLLLKDSEIEYLEKCLKIFNIFIKASTKLQAEKYPTIYYLMPDIYKIYNKLEAIKVEFNVSYILIIIIYVTECKRSRLVCSNKD